ncbi:MAG: hypothetical protein QOJ81_1319 [Chloroflexota bacterium]|jgi:hypothetical protein|nr:hypothetical protein [Chloroflexota bacterium]
MKPRQRATWLHVTDFDRLEDWCHMVRIILWSQPYLVGSALEGADFRDVDIRVLMADKDFDRLSRKRSDVIRFLNRAFSFLTSRWSTSRVCPSGCAAGPIDFQIQRRGQETARSPRSPER